MNDLISRQAAIRWVKTECNPYGKPTLDFESGKKVIGHLEQMPSADAVPVVRCRDCKHFGGDCWCLWYEYGTDGSGYCHHGERKDDE